MLPSHIYLKFKQIYDLKVRFDFWKITILFKISKMAAILKMANYNPARVKKKMLLMFFFIFKGYSTTYKKITDSSRKISNPQYDDKTDWTNTNTQLSRYYGL